jgi:hypothetical protein
MSIQAAVSSAGDFLQASARTKTGNSDEGDALGARGGGKNADFKNVLMAARGNKGCDTGLRGEAGKNLTGGVVIINAPETGDPFAIGATSDGDAMIDASIRDTGGPSRFDPDLILGTMGGPDDGIAGEILPKTENADAGSTDIGDDGGEPDAAAPTADPVTTPVPGADDVAGGVAALNVAGAVIVDEDRVDEQSGGDATQRSSAGKSPAWGAPDKMAATASDEVKATGSVGEKSFRDASEGGELESNVDDVEIPARLREVKAGENESDAGNRQGESPSPAEVLSRVPRQRAADDRPHGMSGRARDAEISPLTAARDDVAERNVARNGADVFGNFSHPDSVFDAARPAEPSPASRVPAAYQLEPGDKFGDGLLLVVGFMSGEDSSEVRIVVEPPAMGRVDVSLKSSSIGVEAMFRVDNEELRQMVQNQLDSLRTSLQAQGIHVSGLSVDIRNGDGRDGRGEPGAKSKKARAAGGGDETEFAEDARVVRLDLERGLLHWVA